MNFRQILVLVNNAVVFNNNLYWVRVRDEQEYY